MQRLNLNKLYYFYVIAKAGSVKGASQRLHLTQPTLSGQLKELEEDLGFQVFTRKHRKLVLNSQGQYLLKKAETLFHLVDDLQNSLAQRGKVERVRIRIGAIQSLSNSFISNFSTRLWSDETIYISVTQGSLPFLISKMESGALDLILSDGPYQRSQKFQSTKLDHEPIVVVASPKFSLGPGRFPKNLDNQPYLSFSNNGRLQEDADHYFEREGIHPEKVGEVDDVTLMRVVTQQGGCFSTLPLRAVKEAVKLKELKVLGKLPQVQYGTWAITPSIASNRSLIKKLIRDYFVRK